METVADSVEVAIIDHDAFIRVHGRGTFKIGPSLKQFGSMAIERGCRRIIVEMQNCVGMDSTFMGILAGLATVLRKNSGEVVLRNLSDKNLFLIKMLGLVHLVTVDEAPQLQGMTENGCSLKVISDKRQMTEVMIKAHESLIDAAPDNIVKFKDVLAYLKEDIKRTPPPSGGVSVPPGQSR